MRNVFLTVVSCARTWRKSNIQISYMAPLQGTLTKCQFFRGIIRCVCPWIGLSVERSHWGNNYTRHAEPSHNIISTPVTLMPTILTLVSGYVHVVPVTSSSCFRGNQRRSRTVVPDYQYQPIGTEEKTPPVAIETNKDSQHRWGSFVIDWYCNVDLYPILVSLISIYIQISLSLPLFLQNNNYAEKETYSHYGHSWYE
jgi:hypothetical protein